MPVQGCTLPLLLLLTFVSNKLGMLNHIKDIPLLMRTVTSDTTFSPTLISFFPYFTVYANVMLASLFTLVMLCWHHCPHYQFSKKLTNFMKSGMNKMPLEVISPLYFLLSYHEQHHRAAICTSPLILINSGRVTSKLSHKKCID